MSGVVISARIAAPAVRGVATKVAMKDDQMVNLWYESGCQYMDHLRLKVGRWSVFHEVFGDVMRRESFKKCTVTEVFARIQESPVFWDWWARVLKLICQELGSSILSRTDLEYYLNTYNALPCGWVIDNVFPKN